MPPDETAVAVQLALLRERQEQENARLERMELHYNSEIARLDKRQIAIEKKVQTGQIALVVLAGIGGFIGWLVTVWDKTKLWFH